MDINIRPAHPDDLIMWPDGYCCDRRELQGHQHRSDDYRVIPADSEEWLQINEEA